MSPLFVLGGGCVFNASADLNPKANLRRDWKREVFGWSPGQGNGLVVPADLQRLFQRPEVGARGPFHTLTSQPAFLWEGCGSGWETSMLGGHALPAALSESLPSPDPGTLGPALRLCVPMRGRASTTAANLEQQTTS